MTEFALVFGHPVKVSDEKRRAAARLATMHARYGDGPAGTTCGACASLIGHHVNRRSFFKCARYGDSSSTATDWRKKWAACGAFVAGVSPSREPADRKSTKKIL